MTDQVRELINWNKILMKMIQRGGGDQLISSQWDAVDRVGRPLNDEEGKKKISQRPTEDLNTSYHQITRDFRLGMGRGGN